MSEDELARLRRQAKEDRKLFQRAERVLGEIDRAEGLSDEHADVLAAVRIRLEGKARASLEDLLGAAGDISGKKDLGDLLSSDPPSGSDRDWPEVEEKKRDWPGP
jgi:hypothetical protein